MCHRTPLLALGQPPCPPHCPHKSAFSSAPAALLCLEQSSLWRGLWEQMLAGRPRSEHLQVLRWGPSHQGEEGQALRSCRSLRAVQGPEVSSPSRLLRPDLGCFYYHCCLPPETPAPLLKEYSLVFNFVNIGQTRAWHKHAYSLLMFISSH